MSDPDGCFLLTRRDHQTILVGSLQEETEFQDVTLVCEDQQLRAHKLMLAASSTKLRSILLSNHHPHPLIYLHGVRVSTLENILIFIYTGEVAISPDQLDSFLKVAQDLQVKGLSEQTGGGEAGGEVYTNTRKAASLAREERPCVKPPTTTGMPEEQDVESQQLSQVSPKVKTDDITEEDGQYEGEGGGYLLEDHEDGDDGGILQAEEADHVPGENICPYCRKSFSFPVQLSPLQKSLRQFQ